MFEKNKLKNYGLGLGLRTAIQKETLSYIKAEAEESCIQWLEIVAENYIYKPKAQLEILKEFMDKGKPIIPHSVNLSIGTAYKTSPRESYDRRLLDGLKDLFKFIQPPWFSDHVSCTRINGFYLQELIPVPFIKESVNTIVDNIKFLEDEFQLPFLIENPSYYSTLIKPEMTEAEFLNEILEKADCGLLLDINNVYVNAVNHNYNAMEFLNSLDLARTVQVHIAGHLEDYQAHLSKRHLKILDTHGELIKEEVFALFKYLLNKIEVKAVLLERDSNFPEFSNIISELAHVKELMIESSLIVNN
jgi:uncharacterized protein (UPF0276 family)